MSAQPRKTVVHTLGHGDIEIVCPEWCQGHEDAPQYRADIFHEGREQQLTLPVRRGRAELLLVAFEERPFTETWTGTAPFVSVGFGGDHHPVRVDGLEAMADALERHAVVLREFAAQLAALLGGEDR